MVTDTFPNRQRPRPPVRDDVRDAVVRGVIAPAAPVVVPLFPASIELRAQEIFAQEVGVNVAYLLLLSRVGRGNPPPGHAIIHACVDAAQALRMTDQDLFDLTLKLAERVGVPLVEYVCGLDAAETAAVVTGEAP